MDDNSNRTTAGFEQILQMASLQECAWLVLGRLFGYYASGSKYIHDKNTKLVNLWVSPLHYGSASETKIPLSCCFHGNSAEMGMDIMCSGTKG